MKNSILFVFFWLFSSGLLYAQSVNQDADGNSSIVWPGGSISFDISENLLKLSYFTPLNNEKGKIYGLDLQGKNNSGTAGLFDENEFTPEAKLSGLIGWHKSDTYLGQYYDSLAIWEFQKDYISELLDDAFTNFKTTFKAKKDNLFSDTNIVLDQDTKNRILLLESDMGKKSVQGIKNIIDEIEKGSKSTGNTALLNTFVNDIKNDPDLVKYETYQTKLENLSKKRSGLSSKKEIYSSKQIIYLRGGLDVQEFKYDRGSEFTDFDQRFMDEKYLSPFIEVGFTKRQKDRFFGINIGIEGSNNFTTLSKADYNLSQDTTLTSGDLTSEESFEAYHGEYKTFAKAKLNLDYMFTSFVGSGKYLYAGPYVRSNYSFDTSALDHSVVIGAGAFLVSGKDGAMLGGIYVQSSYDINEDNTPDFSKTISVGLVAKFAFASSKPSI